MPNLNSNVGRVRAVGMLEGISFILLVGIAVPLKRLADIPEPVRYVGWLHGILFLGYCYLLFQALISGALSFKKSAIAFIAALLPFGPFLLDKKLAGDEERELSGPSAE